MIVSNTILIFLSLLGTVSAGFWLHEFIRWYASKDQLSLEDQKIQLLIDEKNRLEKELSNLREQNEKIQKDYINSQDYIIKGLLVD